MCDVTSEQVRWAAIICAILLSPTATLTQQAPAESRPSKQAAELLAARERFDQTLWGPEVEAQRYETRFVKLWDELIQTDDKFAVLSSFPFTTLTLGKPAGQESLDLGIQRTRFGKAERDLSPAAWTQLLRQFQSEGYEIEHTEWHHSRFDPPRDRTPAHSEVSMAIRASRADPPHRVVVRAVLDVTWSTEVDRQNRPLPEHIAVNDLQILERNAPAAFREVFTVDNLPSRPRIHPLLVYDLDGDGLSEIILGGRNTVLRNRGAGQFEADRFLAHKHTFSDAAILADFTNDGHVDFVAVDLERYPLLFEGDADGRFTKAGRRIADARLQQPQSFTAGDMDADGDLDLFIGNYKKAYEGGQMPTPYYDANDGFPAALLRNDGDGHFTDVTETSGLGPKRFRRMYSSSFVDLDDDADLDLITVNDYAGFDLHLNDGRGVFTDVTDSFGRDRHMFGMAHTFADYDLDGDLDFYVIGMSSTTARRLTAMGLNRGDKPEHNDLRPVMGYGNRMFLRTGDGFALAPFNAQIARTGWSWGASSFDFDNDGDQDIFVANGHVSGESTQDYCTTFWRHDIYVDDSQSDAARESMFQFLLTPLQDAKMSWNGYEPDVLWMNEGGAGFTNVAFLLGTAFDYDGRAVVADDLDADGQVDLIVVEFKNTGTTNDFLLHVYQNRLEETGNWIGVHLREVGSGLSPIGATVTVTTAAGLQMSRVVTGDSFSAQHPTTVHFGLGALTEIDAVEVRWLGGAHRRITRPDPNQYLAVDPPSASK